MADDCTQLIEGIDCVKDFAAQLTQLLDGYDESISQVKESAECSRNNATDYFTNLKAALTKLVDEKEERVLKEITETKSAAVSTLRESQKNVSEQLDGCLKYLQEGKQFLTVDPEESSKQIREFSKDAKKFVKENALQTAPDPHDIPCLYVDLPPGVVEAGVPDLLKVIGQVFPSPPVKFNSCRQWPGGIELGWDESLQALEDVDLTEFKVEKAEGNIKWNDTTAEFQQVYRGKESRCVVRGLKTSQMYSFRVCGQAEGAKMWSPWSVPLVAITNIDPHQWSDKNPAYQTSNDDRVMERTADGPPRILSAGPSLTCGESIVFKILEAPKERYSSPELGGIFLSVSNDPTQNLLSNGYLLVNIEGKIFVNGDEKTTKFPELNKNCTIVFITDVTTHDKPRVTIEVNEFSVTFDWTIKAGNMAQKLSPGNAQASNSFYFGACFTDSGWKVAVE